jgi:hypothetical protein
MVLHTVYTYTASTSGGGTQDTVASSGYYPTGENEVQMRNNALPRWIGFDSSISAVSEGTTTVENYVEVDMNTWTGAQSVYFHHNCMFNTVKDGTQTKPIIWFPNGPMLDRDADWTIKVASDNASVCCTALYLSYGNPIPAQGTRLVSRIPTPADGGVGVAFSGSMTISDLDPRMNYRLAGMYATMENQTACAVKVTSPMNNTEVIGILPGTLDTTDECHHRAVWFPHDSIVVNGTETVQIEASVAAAAKMPCIIYFEEMGAGPVPSSVSVAPTLRPPTGRAGGFGRFLSGLSGR